MDFEPCYRNSSFWACYGNGDGGDDGTYITVTMKCRGTPLWATSRITETTGLTAGAASLLGGGGTPFGDTPFWRHTFLETHFCFGNTSF